MTIVDSTVWIDYLRGRSTDHTEWLDAHLTTERIGLLDLMVCELLQGVPSTKTATTLLSHLQRFEIFDTGGTTLAVATAANYRALRGRGITVRGTIDAFIATFCITHNLPLLHTDRDFAPFEQHLGLRTVTPR